MSDPIWLQEQVIHHPIPQQIVQLEHVEPECRQLIRDKGQVLYERGVPGQRTTSEETRRESGGWKWLRGSIPRPILPIIAATYAAAQPTVGS